MAQAVHVTIHGLEYTVVTEEDPERVEALAARVDEMMRQITNRGVIEPGRAAVLACLHMADQVEALEQQVAALKKLPDQKRKLNDLLHLLDEELK